MDREQAHALLAQPFKARVDGVVYENLLIKSFNDGSDPTVTLLMPTPVGEPDRIRKWRLDQVEILP